jgi:hypothetical protein
MVKCRMGTDSDELMGELADVNGDFPWLFPSCEPLLVLLEMAEKNGRWDAIRPGGPAALASAAAAAPSALSERTLRSISGIDLGAEILLKIDGGGMAVNLYRTESCPVRKCIKVISPSAQATPLLMVCAGHHQVERPLRIIGADYAPLLRGLTRQVFDALSTRNALWQHPILLSPAAPGLFEVILRVLGIRCDQARLDNTNATFIRRSHAIYDADIIAMLFAFQRFDSSQAFSGNGLIKRWSATPTVHMVIAPLTLELETRRSDKTSKLTLRVCSSIRTRSAPDENWVLAPNFHVPKDQLELQHHFGRTISALFGAMFARQCGNIGNDRAYTAIIDEHALAADACIELQTRLAAEYKAEVASNRRKAKADANSAAGAAVHRQPRLPPPALPAAHDENPAQARNRRLADLCRASGARRIMYLDGSESREALLLRVQNRLRHLETVQKSPDTDVPLLFFQQALDELGDDDEKMAD